MATDSPNIKNIGLKVLIPVVIGIVVVVLLFSDDFSMSDLYSIRFGTHTIVGIEVACLFVVGRDFGLTWRLHTIAAPELTWSRALRVDLMCAFTSAITPSAVGGSAFAIFYLNREGVDVGRATTLTLTTLFLDELFFVVFCPIIMLSMPMSQLFGEDGSLVLGSMEAIFWLVYAGIVVWTAILFFGIVVRPQAVKRLLDNIFSWRWLRRFRPAITAMTDNMVATSDWVRRCPVRWWLNVFGATVLSWFSRYLIVNSLIWAFDPEASQLLVFCRQFVVWVLLMVSPTPGGSGVSEWIFTEYYGDLLRNGELAVVIAVIWRLITYYVYLVVGACIVPTYFKKKK